jgi:hypothetical protein
MEYKNMNSDTQRKTYPHNSSSYWTGCKYPPAAGNEGLTKIEKHPDTGQTQLDVCHWAIIYLY